MSEFTPVNQVRITNVAIVRLSRGGKKFEIAAYKNKVVNFREGVENDLDEVLQIDNVFKNVSKGELAKKEDLQRCFDTTDKEVICRQILMKGTLQVSGLERSAQLEKTVKEITNMVVEKCVDPSSNRPFTFNVIADSLKKAKFSVHPTRSIKSQFLDAVKKLKNVLEIERARMLVCVVGLNEETTTAQSVTATLSEKFNTSLIPADSKSGSRELEYLIEPGIYREINDFVSGTLGAQLEIRSVSVQVEGDLDFEQEMSRREEENVKNTTTTTTTTTSKGDDGGGDIDDDETKVSALAEAFVKSTIEERDGARASETDEGVSSLGNSKQQQKKQQKKSKKAKRREKEKEEERRALIEKEKTRVTERAEKLASNASARSTKTTTVVTSTSSSTSTEKCENTEGKKSCNTCGGSFTPAEHRAHFKSDWHRFNLKLKMSGSPIMTEDEFKLEGAELMLM